MALNGVVILSAATYNNNLIYILAFVLFSIFFISMIETHNMLKGVKVRVLGVHDSVAGQPIRGQIQLQNTSGDRKLLVRIQAVKKDMRSKVPVTVNIVNPHSTHLSPFQLKGLPRGVYSMPRMSISSTAPLGLFRAWSYFSAAEKMYVYPIPEGTEYMNQKKAIAVDESHRNGFKVKSGDDFHQHRDYQPGDPLRQVDWKVFARKRKLLSRQYEGESDRILRFSYMDLANMEPEKRLSQLAKWVDKATAMQLPFELIMPNKSLNYGQGKGHMVKCQRELAGFKVTA